jgi:hypothetical protein
MIGSMIVVCAAILFFLPALAAPSSTLASRRINWDASKDGAVKTYRVGDLTLTFSVGPKVGDDDAPPMLTVVSSKFGRKSVTGQAGYGPLKATAVIAAIDPKASGPAVILHTFTDGPHCCTHLDILDPVGGRWMVVHAGDWDGDFSVRPQRTAEGAPYLQLYDDKFLYAFACYACSYAPPRIFTLVGGRWADVSTDPVYAPVFRRDAAEQKKQCTGGDGGGQNGACALYVAEAARFDGFDQAWTYMLDHYDKTDKWDWPTRCTVVREDGACPKGREIVFKTYPEALRNFLRENGYIGEKPRH